MRKIVIGTYLRLNGVMDFSVVDVDVWKVIVVGHITIEGANNVAMMKV